MKKRLLAMTMALCVAATGMMACGKGKEEKTTDESGNVVQDTAADGEAESTSDKKNDNLSEDEQLFEDLFDINNYVQVKIDISNEELQKIQNDYDTYQKRHSKSPIYRRADKVTITIGDKSYEIEDVGVRMKGNTSRESFYDSERGMYNLIHLRLSFDETFDNPDYYGTEAQVWTDENAKLAREERTFATLSSLEMKWNKNFDTTYVREYYANAMFRDFGIMAQHQNIANTVMGGINLGVYSVYEPVDKNFLKKYYDGEENDGDLYKAAWTNSPASYSNGVSYGVEDPDTGMSYNYDLKTNKKTSDNSLLKNLIDTIGKSDVTKESFETVVDGDYWVKFAAVSYFVGNPDDMRNNFNNHYVYIKPDGQAVFVPYDNDRVFGITVGWNPEGTGMTAVSPFSPKADGLGSFQYNPLYLKTVIDEKGFYYNEYVDMLAGVASSKWLTEENFTKYYDIAKKNYENCVTPDKDFENAEKSMFRFSNDDGDENDIYSNMSMKQYLERKLETYNSSISKGTDEQ